MICVSCEKMKLEEGFYVCKLDNHVIVSTEDTDLVLKKIYQQPIWCPKSGGK